MEESTNENKVKLSMDYTGDVNLIQEIAEDYGGDNEINEKHDYQDLTVQLLNKKSERIISNREDDYHRRKFDRLLYLPGDENQNNLNNKDDSDTLLKLQQEEERVQRLIRDRDEKNVYINNQNDNKIKRENNDDDDPFKSVLKQIDSEKYEKFGKKVHFDENDKITKIHTENENKDNLAPAKRKSRWDVADVKPQKKSRWDQPPENEDSKAIEKFVENDNDKGKELELKFNSSISDEELDSLLPAVGYEIVTPPKDYKPNLSQYSNSNSTDSYDNGYNIPTDDRSIKIDLPQDISGIGDLQFFKEEDMKYFGKLFESKKKMEEDFSLEEQKERKIMRLILRVKNGSPPIRKASLRQLTDNARYFGAGPLFNQILPLLMERSLEDQERHLLVKVIDRILYKLDQLVRPYTHRILVVIEPLLIDEDYYARLEGREIISNLSKAAGLAHMISTMRPDIDHVDEYVRNTTARAFAVVASALGIPSLLPFIRAVCKSKKSWQARHTGLKIIQQIAVLMGCGILPHLNGLVLCIADNIKEEQVKNRTMAALSIASLAEAAAPYGIEAFFPIIKPLHDGIRKHRGKVLAAMLKCMGFIIPLMEPEDANHYTKDLMSTLLREFSSPDEEMKKTVLKVVQQCISTDGVTPDYLRRELCGPFFKSYWVRRMALDRRNYKQVVETTVELAQKVGVSEVVGRIINILKDESESYRKMAVETIDKVISSLGATDIDNRMEELLIDGMLYAFQEQTSEDIILLNGFGTVMNSFGLRIKPYLPQIVSTILWRLNNSSPAVRQQAADLISRTASVMKNCDEDALLGKLGEVLYEYLGEEYPEVLGSILGALRSIVMVVGISSMQPPIRDLLPRLTPILRNRHEKVQENTIDLVGRIADRGAEYIPAREWMRICFELLDMLKAHKKGIRRAANNTFGYIAKAIGPQDVLVTLLNNLRVQERQSRVCTAVAIGIVAETCAPFTVLPALMNEYRVPELNVQNGVLKALSFMFEYIGEMAKDYVYSVVPLLEDALIDRDQVHRQTAASVVKHLALGCTGLGVEKCMIHLLNLIMPNIYETSPHVIDRILDSIDAIRNCAGNGIVLNYYWAGLFQAARKVRTPYWRLYNMAYIQSADAMVPYYPQIPGKYHRKELDIWI